MCSCLSQREGAMKHSKKEDYTSTIFSLRKVWMLLFRMDSMAFRCLSLVDSSGSSQCLFARDETVSKWPKMCLMSSTALQQKIMNSSSPFYMNTTPYFQSTLLVDFMLRNYSQSNLQVLKYSCFEKVSKSDCSIRQMEYAFINPLFIFCRRMKTYRKQCFMALGKLTLSYAQFNLNSRTTYQYSVYMCPFNSLKPTPDHQDTALLRWSLKRHSSSINYSPNSLSPFTFRILPVRTISLWPSSVRWRQVI